MANRASNAAVRSDSRLTVRNLMKAYHGRKVVQDVSLDVASGEVVGLLGPNGAGKTTCFYMIVGLVPSDGGSIELDGVPIGRLPIHRRARLGLSYLPQEASVFRKLSVEENVRAVLELQRGDDGRPLPRAEIDRRLDGLLHGPLAAAEGTEEHGDDQEAHGGPCCTSPRLRRSCAGDLPHPRPRAPARRAARRGVHRRRPAAHPLLEPGRREDQRLPARRGPGPALRRQHPGARRRLRPLPVPRRLPPGRHRAQHQRERDQGRARHRL